MIELGSLFGDSIRFKRFKNQVKLVGKIKKIVEENNLSLKQINLKTLVPFIEYSSLEDEESLQDKWANLITNIASTEEDGLGSKLINTLNNLNSFETKILDNLYCEFLIKRKKQFAYY